MKDRKMANLPPSKYKLASIIVRRTNTWREDEYTNVKSVDISVMQVNNSYFKYRATTRKHRGKITRLRGLVAEKHSEIFIHTRQQLLRGLIFNFWRINIAIYNMKMILLMVLKK